MDFLTWINAPNGDLLLGLGAAPCSTGRGILLVQLGPPSWWPFFFPVAGLFVSTQYEMPFKLSISTFHVSITAITAAIASHIKFAILRGDF